MLYYAQMGCESCCDESNFRAITDFVPKIVSSERAKCLQIIANYISKIKDQNDYVTDMFDTIDISQLLIGEYAVEAMKVVKAGLHLMGDSLKRRTVMQMIDCSHHSTVKVRKAAYEVLLKALEDKLSKKEYETSAKRRKPDVPSTILNAIESDDSYLKNILQCLGTGVSDSDENLAKLVRSGIAEYMSEDMAVRYAECLIIAVHLPSTNMSVSLNQMWNPFDSLSASLEMVFSNLRNQERFKSIKLRDEPLELRNTSCATHNLETLSRTYQGTFRSYGATKRKRAVQRQGNTKIDIDVQVPVDNVLDAFLDYATNNFEMSQVMWFEVMRAIHKQRRPNFDFEAVLMNLLLDMMEIPNDISPFVVNATKFLVAQGCGDHRTLAAVEKFNNATRRSEGEEISKNLLQDVNLRQRHDDFVLGYLDLKNHDVVMEAESQSFELKDLLSTFGKLSDWDKMTHRQKRNVLNSSLPLLWTDYQNFSESLECYSGGDGWFSKMVSMYRRGDKRNVIKWLREIDKWPRRHFETSAITEAILWRDQDTSEAVLERLPIDISNSDCLAEWAARLMIRKAYIMSLENNSEEPERSASKLSRSQELQWCVRASEIALAAPVLQCVKRNTGDLYESETLIWLRQKLLSLREMGLQQNNSAILRKALSTAEQYVDQFANHSTLDITVDIHRIILLLRQSLNELSKTDFQSVILDLKLQKETVMTTETKRALSSACELAASYCAEMLAASTERTEQDEYLLIVLDMLGHVMDLGLACARDSLTPLVLNALDSYQSSTLSDDVATRLLVKFENLVDTLDPFAIEHFKAHADLFSAYVLNEFPTVKIILGESVSSLKYKQCLQLVCDPEHSLAQYIERLLKDSEAWAVVFKRIKEKLFENPYGGNSYQLLNTYKSSLYEISEYEPTVEFKTKADAVLYDIYRKLAKEKSALRLSDLCPELAGYKDSGLALEKLLALPPGVSIYKFDEVVTVFKDSIRRPVVIRVQLSDGTRRKYLNKSGECLRTDAAAQTVLQAAGRLLGDRESIVSYTVTPLGEDFGLIEYLEDHERVQKLISSTCSLPVEFPSTLDHELILSPNQSLQQLMRLAEKVPPYALRYALERNSASTQDFICKKRTFLNTLSSMTVLTWILGLGDRHLQNILCSVRDGSVCSVDWAAIFQYGDALELPPARLTRNLLGVCDTQVLESRLQKLMGELREARRLFMPVVRTCFKWMDQDMIAKLTYIEKILEGRCLSYDITQELIENCNKTKHKDKYSKLFNEVFADFEKKDVYSVEEQVCSLLRQCTDLRLLAVTRAGWEPWL